MADNFSVEKYMERIGYHGEVKADFETLSALQYHHFLSVPYENIDILNGVPLSLDTDRLYDKIVLRRRGGYCFELNALFERLLREIGFETASYISRFLLNEPEIPMRRHRVIAVRIGDMRYLADVGVGVEVPVRPLKLVEDEITILRGIRYRLKREPFLGWVLSFCKADEWKPMYAFTEEPQLEIDFIQPDFYCQTHPESVFNKVNMVAIRTENGRYTLDDRTFKIFEDGNVTVRECGEAEIPAVLRRYFGIEVTG